MDGRRPSRVETSSSTLLGRAGRIARPEHAMQMISTGTTYEA